MTSIVNSHKRTKQTDANHGDSEDNFMVNGDEAGRICRGDSFQDAGLKGVFLLGTLQEDVVLY